MPKSTPVTMLVSYYPKKGMEHVLDSMQLARIEAVPLRVLN